MKLDQHSPLQNFLNTQVFLRAEESVSIFATQKTSITSSDLFAKLGFLRKVLGYGSDFLTQRCYRVSFLSSRIYMKRRTCRR
jgi:hypothetical protein